MKAYRECGTHEDVRRVLCRSCRDRARSHEPDPVTDAHGRRSPRQ